MNLNSSTPKFWETKTLSEMTAQEWEMLCDGCGQCCLHKLIDEDDDSLHLTRIACHLLNLKTGKCTDYLNRQERVPDCLKLTPSNTANMEWLPQSCAYRCVDEHRPLPTWHPLISGQTSTVWSHTILGQHDILSETDVKEADWESYVIFQG